LWVPGWNFLGATYSASIVEAFYVFTACGNGCGGYDFGPVDLQLWVTDSFVGNNAPQGPAGINVWSRIGFKIWGT